MPKQGVDEKKQPLQDKKSSFYSTPMICGTYMPFVEKMYLSHSFQKCHFY
jgi:hypothetical protein